MSGIRDHVARTSLPFLFSIVVFHTPPLDDEMCLIIIHNIFGFGPRESENSLKNIKIS